MLTQARIDQFHRDGILLVENVADQNTLAVMRQALAGLVEKSRTVTQHDAIYDLEPDHSAERPRLPQ